jgi:MFS transporter, ACS family, hexuronate transporter
MKIKGLRWWIIGLIALATAINYIDRSALSVLWDSISDEMGFSKQDYANIVTLFLIAYAISQTVSGWLYDKIGTRKGFVVSIVTWSIGCILHGFAWTVRSFSAFRVILGFGEAGNWPGAAKSIEEWHPVKERATATGIFNMGAAVGAIVSIPLVAFLARAVGWRNTFFILGGAGALWLIPWLIINRKKPSEHPFITDEEKEYLLHKDEKLEEKPITRKLFTGFQLLAKKQSWGIMLSRFFLDPVWWMFLVWLPKYLADTYDFDLKAMGMMAWLPYIGGGLGAVFGGKIAGIFINRGFSVNKARKTTITMGCTLMALPLIFIALAQSPVLELSLGILVLLGFQAAMSNIQTMPSDFYQGKEIGKVMGFSGTMSTIGVIIGTQLIPIITKESYAPMFILSAIMVPLGLASAFIGGKIKKVEA